MLFRYLRYAFIISSYSQIRNLAKLFIQNIKWKKYEPVVRSLAFICLKYFFIKSEPIYWYQDLNLYSILFSLYHTVAVSPKKIIDKKKSRNVCPDYIKLLIQFMVFLWFFTFGFKLIQFRWVMYIDSLLSFFLASSHSGANSV